MAKWSYFYVVRIEFLGFRFHGWQKQPGLKSVHLMVDKTLEFVLKHENFKTLGCGRTDGKVSADDFAFELFLNEKWDLTELVKRLNISFPSDIRAKSAEIVDAKFNIIQTPKVKEYHYYFSFGSKSHPFNAPFICDLGENIDIESMIQAAEIFEGTHNFKRFTVKPTENTILKREVIYSKIEKTKRFEGNFFPDEVYVYKIRSKGFLRNQVRLMMGALTILGEGKISMEEFKETLSSPEGKQIDWIAQASALFLHKTEF